MKVSHLILMLLVAASVFADIEQTTLADALENDFQTGAISRAQYVAYRLKGILNHLDLPQRYSAFERQTSPMGTSLMMEARSLLYSSSSQEKSLLESVLSRPVDLPLTYTSPSGLFKLHYTDEGFDAAADTFIVQSALAYDEVFDLIINNLGYPPPPIDDPAEPEYDIYVYAVGGYGLSTPEFSAPSAEYPYGVTSYISMDNDFNNTYTKGLPGMLVTAAHEFFHMVQLGMRNFSSTDMDSRFMYEGMATWMEDFAYEEVNDYVQYLPYYMINMSKSFNAFNGLHEYGSCIFYHMLEKKYGADIIKSIWMEFATKSVWEAYDDALAPFGSSFSAELADHMLWNYFTGERADPDTYYPEGEMNPMFEVEQFYENEEFMGFSCTIEPFSATFIEIDALTIGDLMVRPNMEEPPHWLYSTISHPLNQRANVSTTSATKSSLLPGISSAFTIMIIPTNIYKTTMSTVEAETFNFDLTLGPAGDFSAGIQTIFPNPFQPSQHPNGVRIDVRLTEKTDNFKYHIVSENGLALFSGSMTFDSPLNGDIPIVWDGRNSDGRLVSSGIYYIYVEANQDIKPGKIAVVN